MPDKLVYKEYNDPCLGVYAQNTEPEGIRPTFYRILHNMTLENGMLHTRPGLRKLNGALFGTSPRTMWGMAVWRATPDLIIVGADAVLYSMPASGGDPTTLSTSYPSGFAARTGARYSFAQLGSRLFICNGTDENVKYNGSVLTRMGQTAPSSLSAPSKSAGSLTGIWNYRATLVTSSANGSYESEPTAAVSVTYDTQQGTFTAPTVPSSDPQVDRWFLYRAPQDGGITGSTYYRVNTTAVTLVTSIADNLPDSTLVAGTAMDATGTNSPPPDKFTIVCAHQGRLLGVPTTYPNRIYYSSLGIDAGGIFFKPECFLSTNYIDFGDLGGTHITAIVSFFEWVLIFQDFGVWSINNGIADTTNRVIAPILVGPDNRGSGVSDIGNVAVSENSVFFTAKDGQYRITKRTLFSAPVEAEKVSQQIDLLYNQLDFTTGGASIYDRDRRRYIFVGKGAA